MAWNQPGGNKKDPWNSGGGDQGPDVEAFLARLKSSLGRVFGSGGGNGNGGARGGQGGPNVWLLLVGGLLLWLLIDAWAMIDERQLGVVLRFGKFDRIMTPGPNFKLPRPLETVTKVDVTQLRSYCDQVRMLTRDENIVQIEYNVQYKVSDPQLFLFGARDPDDTLKQAAESAVREVIGTSDMDTVLTGEGAAELAADVRKRLQVVLDSYRTGLAVSVFNLQNRRPPSEVREAFDDAISAREDRERIESEAEAYRSRVVPEARGEAARIRAEAEGYKAMVTAKAQGDAERFRMLAEQYRKAPEVTRQRLYLETMQQVLSGNRKVYAGDGGNVLYLPVPGDASAASASQPALNRLPAASAAMPPSPSLERDVRRPERGGREEVRR